MLFICPNAACQAAYELESAQIPAGKKGFQCQHCGTLVPVESAAPSPAIPASSHPVTPDKHSNKSLLILMGVTVLLSLAGFTYLLLEYRSIVDQSLVVEPDKLPTLTESRRQALQQQLQGKSGAQPASPESPPAVAQ